MWKLVGEARETITKQKAPLSDKEQLQKLLGAKGVKIEYKDIPGPKTDRSNKLPLFTVGCFLTGWGEKEKQIGRGSGNGKKDAGNKAAKMALDNKKMMAEYLKKKEVHDKQLELEREAIAKANGS